MTKKVLFFAVTCVVVGLFSAPVFGEENGDAFCNRFLVTYDATLCAASYAEKLATEVAENEKLTAENKDLVGQNLSLLKDKFFLSERVGDLSKKNTLLTKRVRDLTTANKTLSADNEILNGENEKLFNDKRELATSLERAGRITSGLRGLLVKERETTRGLTSQLKTTKSWLRISLAALFLTLGVIVLLLLRLRGKQRRENKFSLPPDLFRDRGGHEEDDHLEERITELERRLEEDELSAEEESEIAKRLEFLKSERTEATAGFPFTT